MYCLVVCCRPVEGRTPSTASTHTRHRPMPLGGTVSGRRPGKPRQKSPPTLLESSIWNRKQVGRTLAILNKNAKITVRVGGRGVNPVNDAAGLVSKAPSVCTCTRHESVGRSTHQMVRAGHLNGARPPRLRRMELLWSLWQEGRGRPKLGGQASAPRLRQSSAMPHRHRPQRVVDEGSCGGRGNEGNSRATDANRSTSAKLTPSGRNSD